MSEEWFIDLPSGTNTAEAEGDEQEEQYDSPNGSKWIVAVDVTGSVTILRAPNIHYAFFDCGSGAEDVGLPCEVPDTEAGVYEWTCNYSQSLDWESGHADGGEFDVIGEKLLWAVPE